MIQCAVVHGVDILLLLLLLLLLVVLLLLQMVLRLLLILLIISTKIPFKMLINIHIDIPLEMVHIIRHHLIDTFATRFGIRNFRQRDIQRNFKSTPFFFIDSGGVAGIVVVVGGGGRIQMGRGSHVTNYNGTGF